MAKATSDAAEMLLTEAVVALKANGAVCAGYEKAFGDYNWSIALLTKDGKAFRLTIMDVEQ